MKNTLEVSDKLNEVRGAIEEKQAEFEALSKQVETVVINIMLRAEPQSFSPRNLELQRLPSNGVLGRST